MDKITKLTIPHANMLQRELMAAAEQIAAKYGLVAKPCRGLVDREGGSTTQKVEFAVVAEGGIALTREARDFQALAMLFGMEAADLGREVTLNRERYVIVGCKSRASRFPILCKRVADGKVYKFGDQGVARAVRAEKGLPPINELDRLRAAASAAAAGR